jgi:hypothetical protein
MITDDPNDPGINQPGPTGQNKSYLVLSDAEKAKGFVRQVRTKYIHRACGVQTVMGESIAQTYARDPAFYSHTFCVGCRKHFAVAEFVWDGTEEVVGS